MPDLRLRNAEIVKRYTAGARLAEIARLFGLTHARIWQIVGAAGALVTRPRCPDYIYQRRRNLFEAVAAGASLPQAARAEGRSVRGAYGAVYGSQVTVQRLREDLPRLSRYQREVYFAALDDDRLPHADALEVALEFREWGAA